jgi:hypothetical protein
MQILTNGSDIIDGVKYATKVIKYSDGKRVKRWYRITFYGVSLIPTFVERMK